MHTGERPTRNRFFRARALPRMHRRRRRLSNAAGAGPARHRRPDPDVPRLDPNALTVATSIALADVGLPALDVPEIRPRIAGEEYDHRIAALHRRVDADRLIVYGDREHFANLAYLTGFDPRFEEAILRRSGARRPVLLARERRPVVTRRSFTEPCRRRASDQSLSPDGPPGIGAARTESRRRSPRQPVSTVGRRASACVGWKALEASEWGGGCARPSTVPHSSSTPSAAQSPGHRRARSVTSTAVLTSPSRRVARRFRAADQIAAFEWASGTQSLPRDRFVSSHAIIPGFDERRYMAVRADGMESRSLPHVTVLLG